MSIAHERKWEEGESNQIEPSLKPHDNRFQYVWFVHGKQDLQLCARQLDCHNIEQLVWDGQYEDPLAGTTIIVLHKMLGQGSDIQLLKNI